MSAVVGIDLSLTGAGVVSFGESAPARAHLFKSEGHRGDTLLMRQKRLAKLQIEIMNVVPDDALVLIEQPAYSKNMGSAHDRSGVWWLTVDALLGEGFEVIEVAPTRLKKFATGKGGANKDLVLARAVAHPSFAPLDIVDNNIADAAWLAEIGVHLAWADEWGHEAADDHLTVPKREVLDDIRADRVQSLDD